MINDGSLLKVLSDFWSFEFTELRSSWPFCILQSLLYARSSDEADTGAGGHGGEAISSPLGPDVPGPGGHRGDGLPGPPSLPPEGDLGDAPVLPLQRAPGPLQSRDLDNLNIVAGTPEIQHLRYWVDKKY